jgi:hypothetical protein
VVTVAGAIDREVVGPASNITVRATSADGSTADKVFSIGVKRRQRFAVTTPADANAAANAVNEKLGGGHGGRRHSPSPAMQMRRPTQSPTA